MQTYSDALWWWFVSSTTVGYGDVAPVTGMGRIVGVVTIIIGIYGYTNFIAITADSLHGMTNQKHLGTAIVKATDHVVICEYTAFADELIQSLDRYPDLAACGDETLVIEPGFWREYATLSASPTGCWECLQSRVSPTGCQLEGQSTRHGKAADPVAGGGPLRRRLARGQKSPQAFGDAFLPGTPRSYGQCQNDVGPVGELISPWGESVPAACPESAGKP